MNYIFEYIPLALFGLVYIYKGILEATFVLIICSIIIIPILWKKTGKVPKIHIFTAFLLSIMGGLTLFSGNLIFIKMKPTVTSLLFAFILCIGNLLNKMPLKILLNSVFIMSDQYWKKLSIRFCIYFVIMAFLNELIWRTQSEALWVNFKIFGLLIGYIIFMALQIPFLKKHAKFSK